jgi:hypothetical protein
VPYTSHTTYPSACQPNPPIHTYLRTHSSVAAPLPPVRPSPPLRSPPRTRSPPSAPVGPNGAGGERPPGSRRLQLRGHRPLGGHAQLPLPRAAGEDGFGARATAPVASKARGALLWGWDKYRTVYRTYGARDHLGGRGPGGLTIRPLYDTWHVPEPLVCSRGCQGGGGGTCPLGRRLGAETHRQPLLCKSPGPRPHIPPLRADRTPQPPIAPTHVRIHVGARVARFVFLPPRG